MFERFFKPKWQHSNPAVRREAISRFVDRDVEHQRILTRLAGSDPDATVRADALRRLASADAVLTVLRAYNDEVEVREGLGLFWERAGSGTDGGVTLTSLLQSLPADERLRFTRLAPVAAMAEAFVDTLADDAHLASLAADAPFATVRQRAAQAIDTETWLEEVARHSRSRDKGVHRIVRDKLDALRRDREALQDTGAAVEEACVALEQHARQPLDPLYGAKCEHLQKQWQKVAMHADAASLQRYQAALAACRAKLMETDTPTPAVNDSADVARGEAVGERLAACLQLEEALKQLSYSAVLQAEDLPALAGLLTTQRNRWNEAGVQAPPDAAERQRFKQVFAALEALLGAGQRLQGASAAIEASARALLDATTGNIGELDTLRQALEKAAAGIVWPTGIRMPAVLELRDQAIRHHDERLAQLLAEEAALVATIEGGISELAREIDRGNLKAAQQLLRDQQLRVKTLPLRRADALQRRLRELTSRVNELRDWQGFATQPKKEALCEEMESLADASLDPEARAARIRRLQDQWKLLGGGDADRARELWERFSAAADRAYEPCREYFEALARTRAANLEVRKQLCEQLSGYLTGMDWSKADWRAARDILDTARQEWRQASPVDRREGAPLQDRFEAMMSDLHGRIQQEYERNAGKRRRIIAEAESLAASTDLAAAITRAKQLQRDWKDTGLVSARDDSTLWKQFRAACDRVFARRDEVRAAGQAVRDQAASEAESLCEQLEQLLSSPAEAGSLQAIAHRLREQFEALESLPRESAEMLRKRFRAASDEIRHAAIRARNDQVAASRRAFRDELARLDVFEAGLLGGETPAAPEIQASSIPPGLRDALQARRDVLASAARSDDAALTANAGRLIELCLRLEIAADLESPPEDQARRMQFQISRFNKGESRKDATLPPADLAERLQQEWCAVGQVLPSTRASLTARFEAGLERLLEE